MSPELTVAGLWTTPTDIARYIISVQKSYAGSSTKPLRARLAHEMPSPGLGSRGLGPAVSGAGQWVPPAADIHQQLVMPGRRAS